MLAKMVAVFNTSLLNTCQVQSIDLDVGVVGGIENVLNCGQGCSWEGGCREQAEGSPMGRGGAGQGRLQEKANLKQSLVALRFHVYNLSFNCSERNQEGKHVSIHHSFHAAISFLQKDFHLFYFMYVYLDNVRRECGIPLEMDF